MFASLSPDATLNPSRAFICTLHDRHTCTYFIWRLNRHFSRHFYRCRACRVRSVSIAVDTEMDEGDFVKCFLPRAPKQTVTSSFYSCIQGSISTRVHSPTIWDSQNPVGYAFPWHETVMRYVILFIIKYSFVSKTKINSKKNSHNQ